MAVAGLASVLLVAMCVAVAVGVTKKNGGESTDAAPSSNGGVSATTKAVQAICSPTDYKETCEESLSKANTTDPKQLIKVAFDATVKNIQDAIKNSSLFQKAADDERTKGALEVCDETLDTSIEDLKRSFDQIGDFDISKVDDYIDDVKTWLSAAITYHETCIDAFENTTGDTGEKMKKLLKTSGELLSNGLAMVTDFSTILSSLNLGSFSSRRLLADDGIPSFVDARARKSHIFEAKCRPVNGEGFIAKDIGIENTAGANKHQAVAVRASGDKAVFYNVHMDGFQDTLYAHAYRHFYRNCLISGTIDFIFGDAVAVFQNSRLVVRKPMDNQACMVTAQGRKDKRSVGVTVIQNCDIVAEPAFLAVKPALSAYLGRPWKEYSRTIIMQSNIDGFIAPEGWSPWMGTFALDTLYYGEYQNRGAGSNMAKRVKWKGIQKITPQIAKSFTPEVVFAGDEWVRGSGIPYVPGFVQV
ncbi:hypothetical protein DH2020_027474 [Rehmannia glutinosa]|uniref:Pectinesterase n=1 Tax=Rehmannia glutinosa TaxID=99300 RepID=A0ABR0VXW3_REHGL